MRHCPHLHVSRKFALGALPAAAGILALLASAPAQAQLSKGGTPPSQDSARNANLTSQVPIEVMPKVDVVALRAEDELNAGRKDIPWRFGQNIPVDIGPATHGTWSQMADGGRLWRVGIRSKDALSINLLFDQYYLPPGAELYIYSVNKSHTIGAFTDANHQASGSFATTLVLGDHLIVEYYEPANAAFSGTLHLSRVTHGYRDAYGYADKAFGSSGTCNNNANCPISVGWEDQVRSVVMLVSGSSGFCTGTLINNTAQDNTPYILTANHCFSNPSSWVFWFNWESATCQNPGNSPDYDSLSGAVLRARRSDSDFCLVELNDAVPDNFDAYWAGFDYTGNIPTNMVGIHHPAGDIKKFSVDDDPGEISGYGGGAGTTHWRVVDWDDGTTEGGSSGSALFDANRRLVGQLHGGGAACGNDLSDYYGRLSVSWDGANAQQRLRDWLDPAGQDPGAIDGTSPTQYPIDASISAITEPGPDSTTCDTQVAPVVVLRNAGTEDISDVDIEYSVNGGAASVYAWNGLLTSGAVETVTLPVVDLLPGSNTIDINTNSPNGGADQNPANDQRSVTVNVLEATGLQLPFSEDFEGPFPPASWINENPDGQVAWESGAFSAYGSGNGSAFYNNFDDDFRGTTDSLITPFLDLGAAPDVLEFDVAYARYSDNLSDSMEVLVTTDCGQTWDQLWAAGGNELSTNGGVDVSDAFEPADDEWVTHVIDITSYAGISTAQFAFVSVTGWGNNLYLDNVFLGGGSPADDGDGDGFTIGEGDCNDNDPNINPGVPEATCDGIDNDCNSATEDDVDADGDGVSACNNDCDDGDSATYPGAEEICDGLDNDCDGAVPADEADCSCPPGEPNCNDGGNAGGCCSATNVTPGSFGGMLFLFGLVVLGSRRRRRKD